MFNAQTFLRQCLLALTLAIGAASATAGPVNYHVNVNASALTGTGYLDFFMGAAVSAPRATVTISNLSGNILGTDWITGDAVDNLDGSFTLGNGPSFNYLSQLAGFGGSFGFDLAFGGAFLTTPGSEGGVFSVYLLDSSFNSIGNPNGVVSFDLIASPNGAASIDLQHIDDQFATANGVPEPSDLLLMLSGLAVMGAIVRRKQGAAR